jgi:hypothetical protein
MDEKPKTLFPKLDALGFQVEFQSHAEAILSVDFPDAVSELQDVLAVATIPIEEIIAGGGGEAKGTQRLRRALSAVGWAKTCFEVNKVIKTGPLPDQTRESESVTHEIDHVKSMAKGSIALEIEWNNKDPFFDRDLENFKRLHVDGAISVGIIVTRGTTLQDNMPSLVTRFLDERKVQSFENLATWGYEPTSKQRTAITKRTTRKKNPIQWREAFVDKFVSDKFGTATTHWAKLEARVCRGVGNPCPLLLIGLPDRIITFHEGEEALKEVLEAEGEDDA